MTSTLKKSDFYYDLPEKLIAQTPITPRDASRLLCYNLADGEARHNVFSDIKQYLRKGDVLVLNSTKVLEARLFAYDEKGRKYEILLLKRLDLKNWEALIKPAKKAKIGSLLTVNGELKLRINGITDNGVRLIEFFYEGVFEHILSQVGEMPLPPYIKEKCADKNRYQTVYCKSLGSSAAPTAGLHFTNELLSELKDIGVEIVEVLLHVGLGTFRPVKCEELTDHKMHSEYYEIPEETAKIINTAVDENRRIIAVGTTVVRTLESAAENSGHVRAEKMDTNIFIYPPYKFKTVNGIITNFHLPESTLLMLISAFIGREKTLELYDLAIKEQYRFFSFGDAMMLL